MLNKESNKQIQIGLKKAESLIKKIQKMLKDEQYCIDIVHQILAVQGLLKASSEKILKNHIYTCFAEGMATHDSEKKEKLILELIKVMKMNDKF